MKKIIALGALTLMALTGCRSEITTGVEVESADNATLTVSINLYDESADAVLADPATDGELSRTIARRTGQPVERTSNPDKHLLTYSSRLPYDKLDGASKVIGVKSIVLSGDEKNVSVAAQTTTPTDLLDAIKKGQEGEVDGGAIEATIRETSDVILSVTLPGDVSTASSTNSKSVIVKDGNTVTITTPLNDTSDSQVTVKGSNQAPLITTTRLLVVGGVGVTVLALVLAGRRRR